MENLLLISRLKRHGNRMREERYEQELKKGNEISLTPSSLFELIKICRLTRIHTYIQEKENKTKMRC